jgi:hypothetical protein
MGMAPLLQAGMMPLRGTECNKTETMSFYCNFSAQLIVSARSICDISPNGVHHASRKSRSHLSFFGHIREYDTRL